MSLPGNACPPRDPLETIVTTETSKVRFVFLRQMTLCRSFLVPLNVLSGVMVVLMLTASANASASVRTRNTW